MKVMGENLGRFYRAGGKIVVGTDLIHSRDYRKDAVIPCRSSGIFMLRDCP